MALKGSVFFILIAFYRRVYIMDPPVLQHDFQIIFALMPAFLPFEISENQFLVTSQRSLFWENEKALILSDLHLGKAGHFRKSGIGIPQTVMLEDMQRLIAEIQLYQPASLIVIGDLFHSKANKENDFFLKWRNDLPWLNILLVKGNHDILLDEWYREAGIRVVHQAYESGDFIFVHDIRDMATASGKYAFSGHIHPGIRITGQGKQSLQFPCFYFGKKYAVLPAFGKFTGTHPIHPKKGDAVFALVENSVIKM